MQSGAIRIEEMIEDINDYERANPSPMIQDNWGSFGNPIPTYAEGRDYGFIIVVL